MTSAPTFYLIEPNNELQRRVCNIARTFVCRLHVAQETAEAFEQIRRFSPDVVIIGGKLPDAESTLLCRQIRADAYLQACDILLLTAETVPDSLMGLVDDILLTGAPEFEYVMRLQRGVRHSQMRREMQAMRQVLEHIRGEQESAGDYIAETTTHLVEIAAQLQSEVVHSVEREEESVRTAQLDTIAQAAAGLRHEINNPLFAIVGSAESALKRLNSLPNVTEADRKPIAAGLERILRGADRIQQVVEAISEMLTPMTTDYVAGVSMLDLTRNDK